MLRTIFEKAGYSLLVAEDGQQALQIAHEHRGCMALLVSDVRMPGMTGPELCRAITTGNNRVAGVGYDAGPGWNACTGLGIPRGADIIVALNRIG